MAIAGKGTSIAGGEASCGRNRRRSASGSGSSPDFKQGFKGCAKLAFTSAIGGELEQRNDAPTGLARRQAAVERLPGPPIDRVGEELVAEGQAFERLRLALQPVDQMAIIDDPATALARPWMAARHREDEAGAKKAVEPVVIEPDLETMADQPRGSTVEDSPDGEGAGPGDASFGLDKVGTAPLGQGSEGCTLERKGPGDTALRRATTSRTKRP